MRWSMALVMVPALTVASGRGTLARSWAPLDLATSPARPAGGLPRERVAEACRVLADPSRPYGERTMMAKLLAGERSRAAINALAEALLEPGDPNAVSLMRSACARSLRWAAARGDRTATKALYEALADPATEHASGQDIAASLLDARGAKEVFPRVINTMIERTVEGTRAHYGIACSRIESAVQPYHVGWGRTPGLVRAQAAERLPGFFKHSSDRDYVSMLRYFRRRIAEVRRFDREGGSRLLRSIVLGASLRGAEARQELVRWLDNVTSQFMGQKVNALLDEECVRELGRMLPLLDDLKRKRLVVVLDKTCHGRAEEVISGRTSLMQVLRDVAREELEMVRAGGKLRDSVPGRTVTGPLPLRAWGQLTYLRGTGAEHPYLEVLRDPQSYPREIRRIVEASLAPLGRERLFWKDRKEYKDLLASRFAEPDLDDTKTRDHYVLVFDHLMSLAKPEERSALAKEVFGRALSVSDEMVLTVLYFCAQWAFACDRSFPVQVAEWTVEVAERSAASEQPVALDRFSAVLRQLSPEEFDPVMAKLSEKMTENSGRNFQSMEEIEAHQKAFRAEWDKVTKRTVTPETAAAWRAWLERFRELPVFKQAGKRARGEARVETPPRNGLALQADGAR